MQTTALPLLDIRLEHLTRLADGRLVEWEAHGTGAEPLVWVEGGPGLPAHLARADIVPVLDRFRCHLVNAPGNGRSSAPSDESGYDLERIVDFFDAWRREVGLGPVTLMGHSWGGLVAPAWAALHPEGVRRLIVIDGFAGDGSVDPADAAAEQQRTLDRIRDRPWFGEGMAAWDSGLEAWAGAGMTEAHEVDSWRGCMPLFFADADEPVSADHVARLRREMRSNVAIVAAWSGSRAAVDYRPLFARVACPTLVIVGEHDFVCGPVWARALAAAIPAARLIEMAGVGHLPQYEAPADFRAVIDEWLADVG